MSYVVYCHTHIPTGKCYVGWTSMSMERRWLAHCKLADRGSYTHFHRAIRLYGKENDVWKHEVLEECASKEEARDIAEPKWIAARNSFGSSGFNMTTGGEGVPRYFRDSEERRRISEATKLAMSRSDVRERILTAQTSNDVRQRKSKAVRDSWQNELTRRNHRKGWEESTLVKRYSVEQLHCDSLEVIACFTSVSEASRRTGVHKSSILNHLHGNQTHAGGFVWKRVSANQQK